MAKTESLKQLEAEALELQRQIRAKYPMVVPEPWPEELERLQGRLWELGYEIVREEEKSGNPNPLIDHELETKTERLRTELEDLRDEAFNRHRGVVLSDWVTSPDSPGIVINEERAKASPCKCFTYKGRDYCYSPGIIGMLEAGQVPTYCPTKEYEVRPGIKQRFEEFASAAEAAHERIEEIPKGERLIPWLTEMGKELRARGVEV